MNAPEQDPPPWLESVDHTADVGFVVHAPDLPQLFERAAWGMFDLLADLRPVRPRQAHTISAEASDLDALMVAWLSELNFHHITRHLLLNRFQILDLTQQAVTARVEGEPIDPARHVIHTEIKAVTYHDLKVARENQGWWARVIFDL